MWRTEVWLYRPVAAVLRGLWLPTGDATRKAQAAKRSLEERNYAVRSTGDANRWSLFA